MMSAAEDRKFRLIVDGSDEPEPDTVGLRPTDYGNAERLVAQHGDELRYVPGVGWHAWDGVRWRRDDTGEVVRRAKQSARTILTEAEQTDDAQERKILAKWALTSETDPRLRAAISLAESELQVITRADELDAHEWLLTVENGTLDLRDGALQPHAQADLLTKLAPVIYQPDAASDVWDQFLETVTGGDDQLAAFLQRLSGYTLTGSVRDEVLMFVHGPAATGKTTFVETIKAMLGEHAMTADFETFLRRRGDAGIRNDIARLAGARMVLSVEVDDGKALAEGLIKTLTGGDTVTARHLYSESFSFTPAFKLWLAANDRPRVRATDEAMWRRILQVPFTNIIPESQRDPTLKARLREPQHLAAVLAWAVRGCLDWQRHGLQVPDSVRSYTAEYRRENDALADWLADDCQLAAEHWTAAADLRAAYEQWCTNTGTKPLDAGRPWGTALKAHGCTRDRRRAGHGWQGVALNA